jgi:hypothetical protein
MEGIMSIEYIEKNYLIDKDHRFIDPSDPGPRPQVDGNHGGITGFGGGIKLGVKQT